MKYEFAIKKDTLNNGNVIYTPVCRKKNILDKINIFSSPWERIVKIYDHYCIMDLNFVPNLSYEECKEHIQGYQNHLLKLVENQIAEIEFHTLEEVEVES